MRNKIVQKTEYASMEDIDAMNQCEDQAMALLDELNFAFVFQCKKLPSSRRLFIVYFILFHFHFW